MTIATTRTVVASRPVRCSMCTVPIPAGVRHWVVAGYRVCVYCIEPKGAS